MSSRSCLLVLLAPVILAGCSLTGGLPDTPPPLVDMEEPVALLAEPDDEAQRLALPRGGFTGVYVKDSRQGLDEMLEEPEGVLVERVVENSPGAMAGIEPEDLLYEVVLEDGREVQVNWPSGWRKLELEAAPGTSWKVRIDRGGVEKELALGIIERVAPAARAATERFREEKKVGVVLRTATEVEARGAGLAPGAGAVVTGLARSSPWRRDGLRFGDLLVEIGEAEVAHPGVVLDGIRDTEPGDDLLIRYVREGQLAEIVSTTSERESYTRDVSVPPLFSYTADADGSDTQIVYGLIGYEDTGAAWEFTLLWFITFGGGDADELEEIDR